MTVAPHAPPLVCRDLAEATSALRRRGLRLSTPRRLVLEALFAADGPVSAEHLAGRLNLDLASIYRNLETFEQHGLTQHVHLAHGPGLYALLGHGEREYLYCERCGAVQALPPEALEPVRFHVKQQLGYETRFTHFALVGICADCAAQRRSHPAERRTHGAGTADPPANRREP